MGRSHEVPERPYGRGDFDYVREGRAGALFRGRDGMDVRLAAPERDNVVRRERLSFVGVLLAFVASGVQER